MTTSAKKAYEESANQQAAKTFSKIVAVIIVLIVAAFGDVMYIQAMGNKFPNDPALMLMCYIGAFTSFMAVGYLLMGKTLAFRPGGQMIGAWIVFGVELAVIAANILLAFNSKPGGIMEAWAFVSPATPVIHMIGVALIFFMDPDMADRHHAMETQDKINKSTRDLEYVTHQARIDLRYKQMDYVTKALEKAVNSPASLQYIEQFGLDLNASLLTELTGIAAPRNVPPALPAISHTVTALPASKFDPAHAIEAPKQPELAAASFAQEAKIEKEGASTELDRLLYVYNKNGLGSKMSFGEFVEKVQQEKLVGNQFTVTELAKVLVTNGVAPMQLIGQSAPALLKLAKSKQLVPADAELVPDEAESEGADATTEGDGGKQSGKAEKPAKKRRAKKQVENTLTDESANSGNNSEKPGSDQ